jgi:hypothetical protein
MVPHTHHIIPRILLPIEDMTEDDISLDHIKGGDDSDNS